MYVHFSNFVYIIYYYTAVPNMHVQQDVQGYNLH